MPAQSISQARRSRRRAAPPSLGGKVLRLGAAGTHRVARAIARRPARSLSLTAFGVLFAGVAANALYGQHGLHHPNPLIATRALDGTRTASIDKGTIENTAGVQAVPLVREVQIALASGGFYQADIDGRPGPATSSAIAAFQKSAGLPAEGVATPLVLSQIRQQLAAAPNPSPRPNDIASLIQAGDGTSVTESATDNLAGEAKIEKRVDDLSESELVRRIQSGLTSAQVAELSSDGIPGEKTKAAIRAFQKLEGMDVTGSPDPQVLARLIEIGAAE